MRVLVLALLLAAIAAAEAGACSCAAPDVEAALRSGDAAFEGVVVDRERVGTLHQEPVYDHTVRVVREYNVDLPARVTVRGGGQGSMCGVAFRPGRRFAMWVDDPAPKRISASLCSMVDPDDLRRAAAPLPVPAGSGRAAVIVGGRIGVDGAFAVYDFEGRLLAYGFGGGRVLATCRLGAHFLQQGRGRTLLVRRTADLSVVRTLRFPVRPAAAVCRGRDAEHVVVLGSDGRTLARTGGVIRRAGGRGVVALGYTAAIEIHGEEGDERLLVTTLRTGRTRELARLTQSPVSFDFNPDRTRVAFVASDFRNPSAGVPASVFVLNFETGELLRHDVAEADAGQVLWTSNLGLLLIPSRVSRPALDFDDRAQLLGTRPGSGIGSGAFAIVRWRIMQVAGGRLYTSVMSGGRRRSLALLPSSESRDIIAFERRPRLRASRRIPVRRAARAKAARRCARRA